jgi:aspartate kinase
MKDDSEGPGIIVQKYGGSSVADPDKLARVAARVAETVAQGYRVVVVVSAMGKTTDQLLSLARAVCEAPPRRELDMLLSTGERISMALLAMALGRLGIDAISFTGSQSGILTNDRHSGARIIEVRPVRIEDELARGKVVIVAGFQGMSYKREITTLGRGGSDTTAVALAAALGAAWCEICSDVDGVYTADPRVVPEAARLDAIGYDEMQELAEHGAKVLHAQAVEWARKAGIAVYARATAQPPRFGPGGEGVGTRIGADPASRAVDGRGAVAVSGSRRLVEVRLPVAGAAGAELLALLAAEGVALRRFAFGEHGGGVEACFAPDDVPDLPRVERALRERFPGCAVAEVGAVTAVGAGAGSSPEVLRRALAAAASCGAAVTRFEAAPMRLTLFLAPEQVDPVTRAVHAALVA